jgi:hypothetical protein
MTTYHRTFSKNGNFFQMLSIVHGKELGDWAQRIHRAFKLSYGTSKFIALPI